MLDLTIAWSGPGLGLANTGSEEMIFNCTVPLWHDLTWDWHATFGPHWYYSHRALLMMLTNVRDAIHVESLALFALDIFCFYIFIYFARQSHYALIVEYFHFDVICDVINDILIILFLQLHI